MCFNSFNNSKAYIILADEDYKVFEKVDGIFQKYAKSIGGKEVQIPALITKEHLRRCGYFRTFPQHITIAAHIKPRNYEAVSEQMSVEQDDIVCEDFYFTPAACLHIYPTLENKNINENIITTKARVYRYESKQYDGTTRLWDFTVREIVFIGSPEFVKRNLKEAEDYAIQIAHLLGLEGQLVCATDHFYPTSRNKVREKIQLANDLKTELVVKIEEKEVAIASFNYHNTHFSAEYNFDKNGQIVTGCVGFGLERWVAAYNDRLKNK